MSTVLCETQWPVGPVSFGSASRTARSFPAPPPRTERADFQHSALLPASRPGLWDVSRQWRFRSWLLPKSYSTPLRPLPSSLAVYPLISGPADYWAFYQAPLPPLPSWGTAWQQGSFAPRTLLRFSAPTSPSATVSPSATFPVSPVIGPTLLHRFRGGTRTALQLLGLPWSPCCP